MNRSIALVLAVLGSLAGAYWFGGHQTAVAMQARLDAASVRAQAAAAETTKALAAAEQSRRQISQQFEDELNAQPDNGLVCIPDGWVR
ncbi:MAG: hypothetical protein ACOH2H_16295 [Cypionkella sp.]